MSLRDRRRRDRIQERLFFWFVGVPLSLLAAAMLLGIVYSIFAFRQ